MKLKLIIISYLILFCMNILCAHTAGPHSNEICNVIFGFENSLELYNIASRRPEGQNTIKANNLLGNAAAIAIDFFNHKQSNSDYRTTEYKKLEEDLLGAVKLPRPRELAIMAYKHREVCHQGFDYSYGVKTEYQTRWDKGKKLLIDVVSFAFGKPRPLNPSTANFIAMIVYYTHLLGDLEEGETDSLGNIGNYSSMRNELATKIDVYGKNLPNPAHVSNLVEKLRLLKLPSAKPETLGNRYEPSKKIFEVLSEYVPIIISNNVDAHYVFNIEADYQIAA